MKNVILVLIFLAIATTSAFAQIQPTPAKTAEMKQRGPCSDPWITWAHLDATAGIYDPVGFGTYGECNPKFYNNGSWSNYTDLYNAVREYRSSLSQAGVSWNRVAQPNGTIAFYANVGGEKFGVIGKGMRIQNGKLIGNDSAGLVGNDGASLVAAGGGNMVAAGGGNMVAAGGGNFTLQSGEKKRIKIGKSTYLVIRK
jgi:hypothetical protein